MKAVEPFRLPGSVLFPTYIFLTRGARGTHFDVLRHTVVMGIFAQIFCCVTETFTLSI